MAGSCMLVEMVGIVDMVGIVAVVNMLSVADLERISLSHLSHSHNV